MPPKKKASYVYARPGVALPIGFNPSARFQVGGRRTGEIYVVQKGKGFWDSIKNFGKKVWNTVGKPAWNAVKDAKVISSAAGKVNPLLGSVVSQFGVGYKKKRAPARSGGIRLSRGNVSQAK